MGDHEIALARLTSSFMPDRVAMELWGGLLGQPHITADVSSSSIGGLLPSFTPHFDRSL